LRGKRLKIFGFCLLPRVLIVILNDPTEDGYFQIMHTLDPSSSSPGNSISPLSPLYSEVFNFESDSFFTGSDWSVVGDGVGNIYGTERGQWSSDIPTQLHQMPDFHLGQPSIVSEIEIPWTPQVAFHTNVDTGCVAFAPPPGSPYDTYIARQEYLNTRQRATEDIALSVWDDSGDEGWKQVAVPSYANSSIQSHSSPHSERSPFSLIDSPPPTSSPPAHHAESHRHVFSAYGGITRSKPLRGRQRPLTAQEKKEAREVREAKACWACHLSKIKVPLSIFSYCANECLLVAVLSVFSGLALSAVLATNGQKKILPLVLL